MGHPVTTNPFIIMTINMTVVFIVLVVLMYMIKLIHFLDPTKPKEEVTEKVASPEHNPAVTEAAIKALEEKTAASNVPAGISPEVIAVIAAAVTAMGYSSGQVTAIRPIQRETWKLSGREQGIRRL